MTPLGRVISVPHGAKTNEALSVARRQQSSVIPVRNEFGRSLAGYVRVVDLQLAGSKQVETVRPLPRLSRTDSYLHALIKLQAAKADVGLVEDTGGNPLGLLYANRLTQILFSEA